MINPESVKYKKIKNLKILFVSKTNSYSIASFDYEGQRKLGFRWNGNESKESLGTPSANGKPTWMIIPEDFLENLGSVLDIFRRRE